MFDSPLERCPNRNGFVLLDQTRQECARAHHCSHRDCPLAAYFTGLRFKAGRHGKTAVKPRDG